MPLSKAERLAAAAAERAKAAAAKSRRLDPVFPFRVIPLDRRFFGLR